jgi:hypothetical protein
MGIVAPPSQWVSKTQKRNKQTKKKKENKIHIIFYLELVGVNFDLDLELIDEKLGTYIWKKWRK